MATVSKLVLAQLQSEEDQGKERGREREREEGILRWLGIGINNSIRGRLQACIVVRGRDLLYVYI